MSSILKIQERPIFPRRRDGQTTTGNGNITMVSRSSGTSEGAAQDWVLAQGFLKKEALEDYYDKVTSDQRFLKITDAENIYAKLIGDNNLQGNQSITGDINLYGNLNQYGDLKKIIAEHVFVKDEFVNLRDGAEVAIGPGMLSGFNIAKYDGVNNLLFGAGNDGVARVGHEGGELQALLTREDSPSRGLIWYDDATKKAMGTGIMVSELAWRNGDPNEEFYGKTIIASESLRTDVGNVIGVFRHNRIYSYDGNSGILASLGLNNERTILAHPDGTFAAIKIQSADYSTGTTGYKISNELIEGEHLRIRGSFVCTDLIVEKKRAVNGGLRICKASGKIKNVREGVSTSGYGKYYYIEFENPEHGFELNDYFVCQTYTGGNSNKYYRACITGITSDAKREILIYESRNDVYKIEGDGRPVIGDDIVCDNDNYIDLISQSEGRQYITFVNDSHDYMRQGNLLGYAGSESGLAVKDVDHNIIAQFGTKNNIFNFNITSNRLYRSIGSDSYSRIGIQAVAKDNMGIGIGFYLDTADLSSDDAVRLINIGQLHNLNSVTALSAEYGLEIMDKHNNHLLRVGKQGFYTNLKNLKYNYDGSGSIASDAISWDKDGDMSFSDAVKMQWVNSINVGGTNLLKNSNVYVSNTNYNIASYTYSEPPIEGETYTLSIKGELGSDRDKFLAYNSGGSGELCRLYPSNRGEDGIFKKTFTWRIIDGRNTYLNIYQYPYSGKTSSSKIEWIKLEKGNIATDWSPAPEDFTGLATQITKDTITTSYVEALNIKTLGNVTAATFNLGNGNFAVDSLGNLSAKNAMLEGHIIATSGKMGGWDIFNSLMQSLSGNFKIDANDESIAISNEDRTMLINSGELSDIMSVANTLTNVSKIYNLDGSYDYMGGSFRTSLANLTLYPDKKYEIDASSIAVSLSLTLPPLSLSWGKFVAKVQVVNATTSEVIAEVITSNTADVSGSQSLVTLNKTTNNLKKLFTVSSQTSVKVYTEIIITSGAESFTAVGSANFNTCTIKEVTCFSEITPEGMQFIRDKDNYVRIDTSPNACHFIEVCRNGAKQYMG